jgi:hypothetical protein
MLFGFLCLAAFTAAVHAQVMPALTYNGYSNYLATAKTDAECAFYAYDLQRLQAGFGYLFYNPNVCGDAAVPNLVGCTGNLNFTTVRPPPPPLSRWYSHLDAYST